jgi:iron complex outermembrane receptor protein
VNNWPFSYRVYKQVYDKSGKPLEGVYADLNGDGQISDEDRYYYKSPMPRFILGFSTGASYKKWNIATTLRANLDNYVYDNVSSNMGIRNNVLNPINILNNAPVDLLNTNFNVNQFFSDYYVRNASFVKMDNVTLSYSVGEVWKGSNLSISGSLQNVFTISNYKGIDPEISSGIDNRFYPRPRTYVIGLNLSF